MKNKIFYAFILTFISIYIGYEIYFNQYKYQIGL
nr:MAG TPA: hypothetical protein [Caudoviricetes sp.]